MAKTKVEKTVETTTPKAAELLKKGALAYVGLYGFAYDRAKLRAEQVRVAANDLFEDLVKRGTELEGGALKATQDLREKATETVETGTERFNKFFARKDARVVELKKEIERLNAELTTKAKKATPAKRKTVKSKMATEKTGKAA